MDVCSMHSFLAVHHLLIWIASWRLVFINEVMDISVLWVSVCILVSLLTV